MSNLTQSKPQAPDLTAYNVDGLELFFTPDRKVRASQSAIARMCGVSEWTIRNRCSEPTVVNDPKCDVLLAQTSATGGGKQSRLHNARTIKILLKEFNPALWDQFEDFGVDEGLAQMAGVPLPLATAQLEPVAKMPDTRYLAQCMLKLADLEDKLTQAPGISAKLEAIPNNLHRTLAASGDENYYTLRELLDRLGLDAAAVKLSVLSAALHATLRSDKTITVRDIRRQIPGYKKKRRFTKATPWKLSLP